MAVLIYNHRTIIIQYQVSQISAIQVCTCDKQMLTILYFSKAADQPLTGL